MSWQEIGSHVLLECMWMCECFLTTRGLCVCRCVPRSGLGDKYKRLKLFAWLKMKDCKIILLQETHTTMDTEPLWRSEWPGTMYFVHGTSNSKGVCVLVQKGQPMNVHQVCTDPNGRYIIIDIEIDGFRTTLCNIYGPNDDNPEFYVNVIHQIESLPNDNRIIGGDFNLVLNLNIDKKGGKSSTHMKSQTLIKNWIGDTELIDIWRFHHPSSLMYSWQFSAGLILS